MSSGDKLPFIALAVAGIALAGYALFSQKGAETEKKPKTKKTKATPAVEEIKEEAIEQEAEGEDLPSFNFLQRSSTQTEKET